MMTRKELKEMFLGLVRDDEDFAKDVMFELLPMIDLEETKLYPFTEKGWITSVDLDLKMSCKNSDGEVNKSTAYVGDW